MNESLGCFKRVNIYVIASSRLAPTPPKHPETKDIGAQKMMLWKMIHIIPHDPIFLWVSIMSIMLIMLITLFMFMMKLSLLISIS